MPHPTNSSDTCEQEKNARETHFFFSQEKIVSRHSGEDIRLQGHTNGNVKQKFLDHSGSHSACWMKAREGTSNLIFIHPII